MSLWCQLCSTDTPHRFWSSGLVCTNTFKSLEQKMQTESVLDPLQWCQYLRWPSNVWQICCFSKCKHVFLLCIFGRQLRCDVTAGTQDEMLQIFTACLNLDWLGHQVQTWVRWCYSYCDTAIRVCCKKTIIEYVWVNVLHQLQPENQFSNV